jgi:hypothetical protein
MNGMLSEIDKKKPRELFDLALADSITNKGSAIIPVDLKSEYIPLQVDPKLTDKDTLEFLQSKILDYFGVSSPIFANKYTEEEYNSFYESTIEPIAIQLSEAFSIGLLTENELQRGEQIIFFSERLQYASWNTKVSASEVDRTRHYYTQRITSITWQEPMRWKQTPAIAQLRGCRSSQCLSSRKRRQINR